MQKIATDGDQIEDDDDDSDQNIISNRMIPLKSIPELLNEESSLFFQVSTLFLRYLLMTDNKLDCWISISNSNWRLKISTHDFRRTRRKQPQSHDREFRLWPQFWQLSVTFVGRCALQTCGKTLKPYQHRKTGILEQHFAERNFGNAVVNWFVSFELILLKDNEQ
uniref:Uncharacterized protein n=1 Tax=Romanomermis culicivorax TaxID=13658 RepID=A0A915IC03_ROMCU